MIENKFVLFSHWINCFFYKLLNNKRVEVLQTHILKCICLGSLEAFCESLALITLMSGKSRAPKINAVIKRTALRPPLFYSTIFKTFFACGQLSSRKKKEITFFCCLYGVLYYTKSTQKTEKSLEPLLFSCRIYHHKNHS